MSDPRDPAVVRRIYEIRAEVRRRDARPNDGRCGNVSSALAAEFGWEGRWGYLRLLDGTVSWIHCWNRLADGTIVDATADQYQRLWLGDVVILDPSDPKAANYRHAPRKWEIDVGGDGRLTCVFEGETRILNADDAHQPWMAQARSVLRLITGWELDEELVDLAARTLRAKAPGSIATDELTHPLLIRSIQHLGRQSSPPWIAPEFREPLRP
ncbi:MAG TPA: hypothetical protein VHC49_01270 [Mycobacteriales bacterium]|nr:hypothetical protein [Mycobacteriales bacterium]